MASTAGGGVPQGSAFRRRRLDIQESQIVFGGDGFATSLADGPAADKFNSGTMTLTFGRCDGWVLLVRCPR